MSTRIFDNPNNVPELILNNRLHRLDPLGNVQTYDSIACDDEGRVIGITHLAAISSTLPDQTINAGFADSTLTELASIARQNNARAQAALSDQLKTMTGDQAVAYIEASVNTFAQAKPLLKIMARLIIAERDKIWPDLPDA